MLGQEKPDYQIKKATGKRAIAPMYARIRTEKQKGIGLQVLT
jgi:hypothetical protein